MSKIDKLRKKHKQEIFELQEHCKHKEINDWIDHGWAPGHIDGRVKICNECGKSMESESYIPS